MELSLLSRIYGVVAALFFCYVGYGFYIILRAALGATVVQALFELIPAAVLAAVAILGAVLSFIVYFTHSRLTVGICLGILLAATYVTLITNTVAQGIGEKPTAPVGQNPQ
jgi:hypothetical protein